MKVTKAQAQANRAHVVETASELFRERGFDGIGVADLMAAAGFTHGGFYKHFGSKADLMAEAMACGIAQTTALSEGVGASEFVEHYLSREHRDARSTGCTMAALGADAARQSELVRVAFADGVENLVATLIRKNGASAAADAAQARSWILDTLAHAVGALVLSRACPDDSALADEFLAAGRAAILESLRPKQATKAAPRRRSAG
ncbi:TetR family transcriptional regulator [Piscinibacter sp. XHJ-5]|uniref:TetR/AcrR family transcriptional regulator n=1 Tax=Piscinibacter sp. XHJ-5 TaxID=3037797 RepID=UPI0024534CA5|nr:TetR family transcriptional regulator [Piscinibacter sp. XHJ-5]